MGNSWTFMATKLIKRLEPLLAEDSSLFCFVQPTHFTQKDDQSSIWLFGKTYQLCSVLHNIHLLAVMIPYVNRHSMEKLRQKIAILIIFLQK
jgi:hypothetical protein